ncbi:ABC-three component system middle component 1 [Clostridium butyricum]|uniref:ABC-three component system middle component 1 n=1 Tax=Clostridium butyricum TaxID=1492 RepID=UPI0018AA1A6F|nr:ABC-three component system middle component 1 [Clostridium butyricum]MDB2155848.1 hypothetical protein [Clostridium butyricum]
MLQQDNEALSLFKESRRFEFYSNIECWNKTQNGMRINIFSIIIEDERHLKKIWENINNDIAVYFQSTLDNEASRWNLYIFFFVKKNVSSIVKYEIEQDKYCARKIVVENYNKDVEIADYIENRLFNIKIKNNEHKDLKDESLIKIVSRSNKNLVNIINGSEDINEIVDKYLGD